MHSISNKDVSAPASLSNTLPHLLRSFITPWIKDFHRLIPISDPHFEYFSVSHQAMILLALVPITSSLTM